MFKAIDLKKFYRIPADNRDLNYDNFFDNGNIIKDEIEDYNSHNTLRLSINEIKTKLLTLDKIKKDLKL